MQHSLACALSPPAGSADQTRYQAKAQGRGFLLPTLARLRDTSRTGMRHGDPARHIHVGAAPKKALPMAAQSMQITASSA
jgi:hypothetical protein